MLDIASLFDINIKGKLKIEVYIFLQADIYVEIDTNKENCVN
jgi:hypothetical protein